jgi:hypothetical protein
VNYFTFHTHSLGAISAQWSQEKTAGSLVTASASGGSRSAAKLARDR